MSRLLPPWAGILPPLDATPTARTAARAYPALWLCLLVLLVALLPRVLLPGDFLTADEADHWQQRSLAFLRAMQAGEWDETNQTGHPGVTTMWLGAAGTLLYETLDGGGAPIAPYFAAIDDDNYAQAAALAREHDAQYALYRQLVRLPVALINAVWVLVMFVLLWRLLVPATAVLAALFLATDPFLLAHGRVLHVDSLLTVCMSISLLALLAALFGTGTTPTRAHGGFVLLSAVAGGLALLTKSPSVVLLPLVGMVAWAAWWQQQRDAGTVRLTTLVRPVVVVLLWGVVAVLTWLALYPAAWVDTAGTVQTIVAEVRDNGAVPHANGQFFLGRVVEDPGGLFYPVAVLLRATPWVLLGIGLLAWRVPAAARPARGWVVGLLVVAVLLFLAVLSIPAKKFDRYILPVFPWLAILAAIGLGGVWQYVVQRSTMWANKDAAWAGNNADLAARWRWWCGVARLRPVATLPVLLFALLAGTLLWYHPYYLAYYNPLVGGGSVASRTMVVGWGEGLEQAAAYIRQQPDGCDFPLASWYERVILPYSCNAVMHTGRAATPGEVNYLVTYINQEQRAIDATMLATAAERDALVHEVVIHGVPYARVYQTAPRVQFPLGAAFGDTVRLVGYDFASASDRADDPPFVTLHWQAQATPPLDYMLFLHVLDADGAVVARYDVPPAGPDVPPTQWRAPHYYRWTQALPLDAAQREQAAWLALGVYDPASGARLPLADAPATPNAPPYGDGALVVPLVAAPPE